MSDFLHPSPSLLCKLASIAVHAEKLISPAGHKFDHVALESAMRDSEVAVWLEAMDAAAMIPRKRMR